MPSNRFTGVMPEAQHGFPRFREERGHPQRLRGSVRRKGWKVLAEGDRSSRRDWPEHGTRNGTTGKGRRKEAQSKGREYRGRAEAEASGSREQHLRRAARSTPERR